jgi:hypothetical protein
MNGDAGKTLLRIEQILEGLLRCAVSPKLDQIRSDKRLNQIYELTGNSGVAEIAKKVRVSTGKISGLWRHWEDSGLIVKDGKSFRKLV